MRWREQAGPGSGLWYDLGPHLVDQALQLFGLPTAVTAHLARLLARDRDVVVVAMGRGGPPEPELIAAPPTVEELVERSRAGRHAASDRRRNTLPPSPKRPHTDARKGLGFRRPEPARERRGRRGFRSTHCSRLEAIFRPAKGCSNRHFFAGRTSPAETVVLGPSGWAVRRSREPRERPLRRGTNRPCRRSSGPAA